jgi:hypothetical protein
VINFSGEFGDGPSGHQVIEIAGSAEIAKKSELKS